MKSENNQDKVIIFCPSKGWPCGIARYSEYVRESLSSMGYRACVVANIDEALAAKDINSTTLIIQHEYGIYNNNNTNFKAPTTAELIRLNHQLKQDCKQYSSCLIMHTFHPADHVAALTNMDILSSGINVFHLNSLGSSLYNIHYLEHGIPQLNPSGFEKPRAPGKRKNSFTISTFGLLSPNKRVHALIDVASECGAKVLANFSTTNQESAYNLVSYAEGKGVDLSLTTEFLSEPELITLISRADVCVSLQDEISHYATSGSARLMLNAGKPLVTSRATQFGDLQQASVQAPEHQIPEVLKALRDDVEFYNHMTNLGRTFSKKNAIGSVYASLLNRLDASSDSQRVPGHFFQTGQSFWSPSRSLFSCNELPKLFSQISNQSNPEFHEIRREAAVRLAELPGVIRRVEGDVKPYFNQSHDPALSAFARHFACYSQIRDAINTVRELSHNPSTPHSHLLNLDTIDPKSIKTVVRGINILEPDEKLSLLDQVLSPEAHSEELSLEQQRFNLWLNHKITTQQPQDAPLEATVITTLTLQPNVAKHFLSLLLPSYQQTIDRYFADCSAPPQKPVKRIPWSHGLLSELLATKAESNQSVRHGSSESSFLNRYQFFIEEFLWMSPECFAKYVQLAFTKLPPRPKRTRYIIERIQSSNNSLSARIAILCESLKYSYWERGIPLVLLSYKDDFSGLNRDCNKQLPHIKLLIDAEPYLLYSDFVCEDNDFKESVASDDELIPAFITSSNLNNTDPVAKCGLLSSVPDFVQGLNLDCCPSPIFLLTPYHIERDDQAFHIPSMNNGSRPVGSAVARAGLAH
jgi:hypothetical protein